MESLIFGLQATVPVFMMVVLGIVFKKLNIINDSFASQLNKFVFVVCLPVLLFEDMATISFDAVWDIKFIGFCFIVTIISIALVILISYCLKDKSIQAEFIQASYRSSAALLGIALVSNIYGNTPMVALMIIGSVPLYNIVAVFVLSFYQPDQNVLNKEVLKKTFINVIKNPILIGIVIGMIYSMVRLPYPLILAKTVDSVASLATPLGLMAMGASFDFDKALGKIKPTLVAVFIKLFGFCILFLPVAIKLGFRNDQLVAILIMLGSCTTVSSYIMAKNMGHEGVLTSSAILLTLLLSGFSITFWISILHSFSLI